MYQEISVSIRVLAKNSHDAHVVLMQLRLNKFSRFNNAPDGSGETMMLRLTSETAAMNQEALSIEKLRDLLEIPHPRQGGFIESLPFSRGDATAGSETELQAAVFGDRKRVDLPLTIESSNYFGNRSEGIR